MLCLGNSLATVVMCIACVLISIMPIKTTRRPDRQLIDAVNTEGRGNTSVFIQDNTEAAGTEASGGHTAANPSRGRVNVKAVRMTALWPKESDGYVVIPYALAGYPPALRPDPSFVESIFKYISDKLCVKFESGTPQTDCYFSVSKPTICVRSDQDSRACFSDDTGFHANAAAGGEAQILHVPTARCPFHEGVQSVSRLLGLLPEHRRRDRDETLKVTVTATGTGRLLFLQGQTVRCGDYRDDTPLDLFSVSGYDTSASTLRHGNIDGILAIEHGMVIRARNIRHQWILDYKRQRNMGLSFYDHRDLVRAYGCEKVWDCTRLGACQNGGFRDRHCRCVCPPGLGGETCAERPLPADEDPLTSNCSTILRSQASFTLADIGLQLDEHRFYACDITLVPPGCMRALLQVNTSSLRPLKTAVNVDFQDSNWCELYFTLLLKHSVLGWRTYCLDYFFNEETLAFMAHSSIDRTYGYMKIHVPRPSTFPMIANIAFNVTFVEVPECGKKGARDRGGASIKIHSYTIMTAVFCYFAGVMLGIVGWIVMRGLCMAPEEGQLFQDDGSPASSASPSYTSLVSLPSTPIPTPVPSPLPLRTPTPMPEPAPTAGSQPQPPPAIRLPPPEIGVPPPAGSSGAPGDRPYPKKTRPPQTVDRPPQTVDRPPRAPAAGRQPPPRQQLHLPSIGQGQRLTPRQGGLRASFVHWGGAALSSLRASFARTGRAAEGDSRPPQQGEPRPSPQGEPRPSPQGGSRPSPQGGSRPSPQGGSRPSPQGRSRPSPQGGSRPSPQGGSRPPLQGGSRPPTRYKTSPSRPGARRAPP